MGRKVIVAAVAVAIGIGAPALLPEAGRASAQGGGNCSCFAAFDAIDSDLRNIGRYYKTATVGGAGGCASACATWRRDWFTRDACDNPTRINRGTRASWGYEQGGSETFIGPDTWWCPFPPP
jgi:hypothetical protein